ncbi:gfo/Idh/MocA family oxidoreductase [Marinobacter salarius]|uniref:Gfo/Idh/MocA family protein n=1 Tax=Marinobacter salarius TaxID=1420917 RepID=UPI001BCECCB7|nr:Gfo/Idh/MocA family oxidoreductase [Marinobacter salarius]MBS8230192.1 gfo/Idh/MocA family oxidoreductase [Marinobacter salarius]
MIRRALVAGLGSIGARHLRLLREALPDTEILILRHNDCSKPVPHADGCITRLDEACAFAPQVAVIASPAPFHLETAHALAGCGAHLLIEKPLAASTAGVETFLSDCAAKGVLVQVGYNLRMLETLQRFRTELIKGRIGKVQSVRCEIGQYLPSWRPKSDYRQTVSARRDLGGGVLLELSHELDMLRWVFGEVDWVSGWSGQLGALDVDVEDSAYLNLGFDSGVVGSVGMDFLRRDATRSCTAIAEAGTLRWDAVAGQVSLFSAENNQWQVLAEKKADRDASYRDQMKLFLGAVASGETPPIAAMGADGLAVLNIIDAAKRSVENNGRQISLVSKEANA